MTQFLQVRADSSQIVIDCRYVQEVGIWQNPGPPAREAVWDDIVLDGVSLTELLGLPETQVEAVVVLRDPNSEKPSILLGVSEIVGLINLPSHAFQSVLADQLGSPLVCSAVFSYDHDGILLRLDVDAALGALQQVPSASQPSDGKYSPAP